MKRITSSGLLPISHDRSKDWSHKDAFGAAVVIPASLNRSTLPVDDQDLPMPTNFCTAYGTSKAIGYQRGKDMSPEYQAAVIGAFAGQPIMDGTDPATAMQAAVLNGSLSKQYAPYTLAQKGAAFIAQYANWPSILSKLALPNAPTGWFAVADAPAFDVFDDIREALTVAQSDNGVVMGFGFWYEEWNDAANDPEKKGVMPVPTSAPISRHNYDYVDFKTLADGTQVLVAQLSEGTDFGDQGFCYFPRETVNVAWANMIANQTGLYIFRTYGTKDLATVAAALFANARAAISRWLAFLQSQPTDEAAVPPIVAPIATPAPIPAAVDPDSIVYPWDTPAHMFHNTRVLADLAGLSVDDKNVLSACIYQESQFNNGAINHNRDSAGKILSTDWGLCQINDYYHIGEGKDFPTVQYVLENPDKVVAWMIAQQQHGGLKQWVSYTSGAYKAWLPEGSVMWRLKS